MQNENRNSWHRIADRLDGMDLLPGETALDRDSAWSGIHGRLYPAKKKVAFWWAAAVLLICFSIAGVLRYSPVGSGSLASDQVKGTSANKNKPVPAAPAAGRNEAASGSRAAISATAVKPTIETSLPSEIPPRQAKTKQPLPATANRKPAHAEATAVRKDSHPDNNEVAVNAMAAFTDSVQAMPSGTLFRIAPVKPDSSLLVATAHKPLRVVHLNDLEEPGFPETGRDNAVKGNVFSTASRFPIGYFTGPSSTSANAGLAAPRNSFFRINLDR